MPAQHGVPHALEQRRQSLELVGNAQRPVGAGEIGGRDLVAERDGEVERGELVDELLLVIVEVLAVALETSENERAPAGSECAGQGTAACVTDDEAG
jgi:hypothetical protein